MEHGRQKINGGAEYDTTITRLTSPLNLFLNDSRSLFACLQTPRAYLPL